jgi:Glutamine synthetase
MKETLGEHIFNHFYIVKKKEVDMYRAEVTEWELKNLLPVL